MSHTYADLSTWLRDYHFIPLTLSQPTQYWIDVQTNIIAHTVFEAGNYTLVRMTKGDMVTAFALILLDYYSLGNEDQCILLAQGRMRELKITEGETYVH